MAPIHVAFIKIKTKYQLLIIVLLMLMSSLMHRPVHNLYVFQSVLYFLPVYLIGISCSIHKEWLYSKLKGKDLYLLGLVVGLAILETSLGFSGNYHKPPFEFKGIDILFYKKIIMCLFFMIFLNRFENISNKFTHILASTSFTIFFIHPYLLWQLGGIFSSSKWGNSNSWIFFICIVAVMILSCIAIALLVKKIIPKYSRNIIGY
jgi:peptidoglycan/LPS O-acetylase OafA/YrhL